MKEAISLDGIVTYAPYTPGIQHGQHFWLSGQIAIDGRDDITSQTEGALAKIDALLEAGGMSKNDICFAQVLLDTIEDYGAMNDVYGAWVADMDIEIAPESEDIDQLDDELSGEPDAPPDAGAPGA